MAFGSLKPIIDAESSNVLQQHQLEMTLNVMCNSLIYWAQDLFHADLLQKGSQIIAMTSAGGQRQWKSYGAVSAAKASLESYCRQLALELAEFGIAANALQAGVTETPALRKIPGYKDMLDNALRNSVKESPCSLDSIRLWPTMMCGKRGWDMEAFHDLSLMVIDSRSCFDRLSTNGVSLPD